MRRAILWAVVVAAIVTPISSRAYADDDISISSAGVEKGRIPLLWFAPTGGFSTLPYHYSTYKGEVGQPLMPSNQRDSTMKGAFGPEARLRIDGGAFAIAGDGFYNLITSNNVAASANARFVFASGLGGRSSMKLTQHVGTTYTSTERIDHYRQYDNKELPVIYGLAFGTTLIATRGINVTPGLTPIDANGNFVENAVVHVPARLLKTIEAGFAVIAGQLELYAAPLYEFANGKPGARWDVMWAFPIGSIPLFFRMNGTHFIGAESDVGTIFMSSIGLGTTLGVSTSP